MCSGGAPGHRECDTSISQINRLIHELDQASLSSMSQSSRPRSDVGGSMQTFQEQTLSSARQLLEHVDPIRSAAKGETENLAHLVRRIDF
jgi:talin